MTTAASAAAQDAIRAEPQPGGGHVAAMRESEIVESDGAKYDLGIKGVACSCRVVDGGHCESTMVAGRDRAADGGHWWLATAELLMGATEKGQFVDFAESNFPTGSLLPAVGSMERVRERVLARELRGRKASSTTTSAWASSSSSVPSSVPLLLLHMQHLWVGCPAVVASRSSSSWPWRVNSSSVVD